MDTKTIKQLIADHRDDFLKALDAIMQIQSVKGAPAPHAPFGKGPRAVLDAVVKLGQEYGFQTGIVNDAMAYVQWGDDNADYVGIVGHLDVVPAGDGWSYPPFKLSEKDGRFFGRGVLDNKGASIASLYGMKLLKDAGVKLSRTVRLIFGSDEESGSADVPLYLKQEKAPRFGFTPDCKWPVVYGERGIVNYQIKTPLPTETLDQLSDIVGDQAMDHVPDELTVALNGKPLTVKGKRTPTNAPEMGENAITWLAKNAVDDDLVHGPLKEYFQWVVAALHEKHYGEGLDIAFEDADSGKLIVTPYKLTKQDDAMVLEVAMRYPVTYTEADVTAGLTKAVPAGSTITVIRSLPGVMHDKHDPFITELSKVYEDVTGLDGTPLTTTGATYARAMPNIVAYGPSFPGQKGIAHKQDEWMDEKDLMLNMAVYMSAIIAMGNQQ
ncbi:Sapep family Mn(2+)-dependent dipeptidase [Lacticaseibacillus jixianensis]|uniref:Sapep family Mn(2+)-dependent dipeptidase n=1 Tax=Lacticaseibacillus jixianensis TaxID=2486012 RepID=A0ABW4B9E6_9LACO|nr:Sapep family Mn(2+)-dependent dipeptidase [Lacticaseibacillus jixianensis]